MQSKLLAARKAAAAGITTIIADGRAAARPARRARSDHRRRDDRPPGTDRMARRKHWIAHTVKPAGAICCDAGAMAAVRQRGRSLLPSGITGVSGRFEAGDCVSLVGPEGEEFARGLSSYGSGEVTRIAGRRSTDVETVLGYRWATPSVHRNDLVVTVPDGMRSGTSG
jgi:glutamate 5-kinase